MDDTRVTDADSALSVGSKDLLAMVLDATNDGIWAWHIPTGEAYFSPRYYSMLGYEPGELPSSYDTWASLLHPDDFEKTRKIIQTHIDTNSDSYDVEFRMRTKTGRWLWVLGRGKVVERDDKGKPLRMVGSHVNIDIRKRNEQKLDVYKKQLEEMVAERSLALAKTSSLLEAIFDAIPDVIGVQDNEHRIIRYNAAGYRFLNKNHDEVVGKRCFELLGRDGECDLCATSICYRTKKPASVERYEKALDVWLDVRAYPILDENNEVVTVIEHLRDITQAKNAERENKQLLEQLYQSQKMEAVGTLAAGMAHEINNPLAGLMQTVSVLSGRLTDREIPSNRKAAAELGLSFDQIIAYMEKRGILHMISAITDSGRRMADIVSNMLSFARKDDERTSSHSIAELIEKSLELAAADYNAKKQYDFKRIEIRKMYAHNLPAVTCEGAKIQQVLLNIFINGAQAMQSSETEKPCFTIHTQFEKELEMVRIDITDNGPGMDENVRERIFEPFYTTKPTGAGTGLGLSISYFIITKNHGGDMQVVSEPGRGTTFIIKLPTTHDSFDLLSRGAFP